MLEIDLICVIAWFIISLPFFSCFGLIFMNFDDWCIIWDRQLNMEEYYMGIHYSRTPINGRQYYKPIILCFFY